MATLVLIVGILAVAIGVLFVGQGSGYIPWPASSFMINETKWIYYGGTIALMGLVLIVVARR